LAAFAALAFDAAAAAALAADAFFSAAAIGCKCFLC